MAVDVTAVAVKDDQTTRLTEKAAPKTINEEVGCLLCVLGERDDFIRAKLKREKSLKLTVKTQVARPFSEPEKG